MSDYTDFKTRKVRTVTSPDGLTYDIIRYGEKYDGNGEWRPIRLVPVVDGRLPGPRYEPSYD